MQFNQIRKMAAAMGINTYRMDKTRMIRMIQRQEGNLDCYGTKRVGECNEPTCLWREACLARGGREDGGV